MSVEREVVFFFSLSPSEDYLIKLVGIEIERDAYLLEA